MSIVAISRGTFSGGQALAECLAGRLGCPCLSREVVLDAAASLGVPVEKFVEAMEKPPSFWERLTGERGDYLNYLRAAFYEYARHDNLVYHGYAGHLLIPGVSHVIKIRVIADVEDRVRTAMNRHGLDRKSALARVKQVDRERGEWMRFLFGVDWNDPTLYDVVVNISRLGVDGACDVVLAAAGLDAFRPTAQSRQAVEDLILANRVWITLAQDPSTEGASVKVVAQNGRVTITGQAISWDIADAIQRVASGVDGVTDVKSEVNVNPLYATPI